MKYLEDFQVGEVLQAGSSVVSREEILQFAQQFDPQPFHVDDEAARSSIFGGIIASGWHTAAMAHRLLVKHVLSISAAMGSPGIDELRWLLPVRPGDELLLRLEVLSITPSRSKPDRGVIKMKMEVRNQKAELVMTEIATALFARRPSP
jgi:acyl dehydratase